MASSGKPWTILKFFSAFKDPEDALSERVSAELSLWKKKISRHYCFFSHTAVCYIYEGSLILSIGEETRTVKEGDLYVMRAGVEWSCHLQGKEPTRVLSVAFTGCLSDEIIRSYLGDDDIIFPRSGCRGLCDRLLEAGERKGIGSRELFDEFILFLLHSCQRLSSNDEGKNEAMLSRRVRQHILRWALTNKLSVKSIAKTFSLRVQDLQELFKESFGVTVHRYIQEVRLEKAAELLSMSSISISQIAEEIGYSDRCYLDKLFLKKYGVTPSAYRKLHQTSE